MATRAAAEKWLAELTGLPTASGREEAAVSWVDAWVARRPDLRFSQDSGGNVLITQKGRRSKAPVVAVAHMDHPAFVITDVVDDIAHFEFRGGVNTEYFEDAVVQVVSRDGGGGTVTSYDPASSTGTLAVAKDVLVGDILMWKMSKPRSRKDIHAAPACDDLAGCAAALAALDRCRGKADLRHFGVLLTRAEEVGLIGALHAAKHETVGRDTRILSIETSRALPNAPLGGGPVIRTGDYHSVFDRDLTNRITVAARSEGLRHQRRLMDGGGCEATAFGSFGYPTAALCVPLRYHHNRGNLDEFELGTADPVPMHEEISVSDFHGLVDLLVLAARAVDTPDASVESLDRLYEANRHYLT